MDDATPTELAAADKGALSKLRDEAIKKMGPSLPQRLSQKYSKGPLSMLKRCMESNVRVKVWVRRFAGCKGTVEGFLLAFDKHMNLVLGDAEENFVVCVGYRDNGDGPILRPRQRFFPQVFLRGDNVMIISTSQYRR